MPAYRRSCRRNLNPLDYITNLSLISHGLVQESKDLLEFKQHPDDKEEILKDLELIKMNLKKVNDHGESAARIVKGIENLICNAFSYTIKKYKEQKGEGAVVNVSTSFRKRV